MKLYELIKQIREEIDSHQISSYNELRDRFVNGWDSSAPISNSYAGTDKFLTNPVYGGRCVGFYFKESDMVRYDVNFDLKNTEVVVRVNDHTVSSGWGIKESFLIDKNDLILDLDETSLILSYNKVLAMDISYKLNHRMFEL